jgi:hypothetical protein
LLWVNLHGAFIIGFVLVGVYLAGNLLDWALRRGTQSLEAKQKFIVLGLVLLASLLLALINPFFYEIYLFPFELVSQQFLMDYIVEYLSPDFHQWMPFRYLLYASIALFALSRSKVNPIELVLLLLFTHLALYSVRHIPLYAIIVAPILLRQAQFLLDGADGRWLQRFKDSSASVGFTNSCSEGLLWTVGAVVGVCFLATNGKLNFTLDKSTAPLAAIEFLKREKLDGNMFNPMVFGGYLIYGTWPRYRVFVDGRVDMYGADVMKEHDEILRPSPQWKSILEKYNINFIFTNTHSSFSMLLRERKDWKTIYTDNVATVFLKDTAENRPILQRLSFGE